MLLLFESEVVFKRTHEVSSARGDEVLVDVLIFGVVEGPCDAVEDVKVVVECEVDAKQVKGADANAEGAAETARGVDRSNGTGIDILSVRGAVDSTSDFVTLS